MLAHTPRRRASRKDLGLTLALWIVSVAVVLVVSQRERRQELERVELETRITGEQVLLRLGACLDARFALVESLAGHGWEDIGALRRGWAQRAEPLWELLPGVLALNYVNPASVIEIVVPREINVGALEAVLFENPHPSVPAAIRSALTGTLSRTAPIRLLQSGSGFATYLPVSDASGKMLGYANGVFRIMPLMETCLADSMLEENYQLAFFEGDGDEAFYVKPRGAAPRPWSNVQHFSVPAADRPWRMQIAPRPAAPTAVYRFDERLIAGVGLVLSSLGACFAWLLLTRQRALRESRQRFQFLVENQSDYVVQLDGDGRLTYASPNFNRSQGVRNGELLGRQLAEFVEQDSANDEAALREKLREPGAQARVELSMRTVSGRRWIAWSFAGASDGAGETDLLNGTGRDLTDLRLLEKRVAHADKMRAIGEMAGGISHDFNNLLQVMLGNVELLKLQSSAAQAEQLDQLEAALLRALSLTGKLGTLSRQQIGERKPIDLCRFIRDVAGLVRHTLPATMLMQVDALEGPVTVMADPAQLEQVFLNLAFNARDSIDAKGTIRIELGVESLDEDACRTVPGLTPGDYARLAVCDDGCGIVPEVLPKIFDPFFTTKGVGTGQGLGLSNCDTIVREHGGTISARSTQGSGSTFTVLLPLAPQAGESPAPVETPVRAPSRSGDSVLVADDNREICILVERALASAGYQTLCAENGQEALDMFREHRANIRLVIMDLVMPVMDGREAAARMRELSDSVQILFISGFVPADDGADISQETMLRKPFRSSELLARVRTAIGEAPDPDA